MIVPDVNVLVHAFREDAVAHTRYADWLNEVAGGPEPVGLPESSVAGFLRLVTNRSVFDEPASAAEAVAFVDALVRARATSWLVSPRSQWSAYARLVRDDPGVVGRLVPDALLAALCLANGATLATADRGFARYPGLRWFDPGRPLQG